MPGVAERWRRSLLWPSLALLMVNLAIAWPLFHVEYLSQTGTGEPLTLAYARYARDHWPDLGWCRFWFGGIPFQNAYVPGLHLTVAAFSYVARISVARAFHMVVAAMYSLGPVALFWMAFRLTRSAAWSFIAGLCYSLTSPSALLSTEIRNDLGSLFWDQRLHTMVFYADNPHVVSLTLLPLAILALDAALERRRPIYYVAAALAMAAVPLTNVPGGIALACAVIAYGLATAHGDGPRRWARIAGVGALAYAFALPWLPPSTILTTQADAQSTNPAHRFSLHHLGYLAAAIVCTWILLRLFSAARVPAYLRFFLLFFVYQAAITLGHYWLDVTLIAEPHRFHLAMEMGFTLSVVFAARLPAERWTVLRTPLAVLFAMLCVYQFVDYYGYARRLIHGIDITRTSEYKTARWFDAHMRDSRVMVPGSSTFWLNLFTDTPQLTGCCMQSVLTQIIPYANFGMTTDLNAGDRAFENSALWLKALGVRAVAVSGPHSTEFYKPFAHPHKFDGHFPVLWRDGDDAIYEVPWRYYSLAHALEPGEMVQRTPVHGMDSEPLIPYVAALDRADAPELQMRWLDNETAVISGNVRAGQIVSVQENAHFGWHATVDGAPRRIFADRLGFLAVVPECMGSCTIRLHYDGGTEMRAAHWITGAALLGSLLWAGIGLLARRHQGA
ncbi:MAG TPA: hypothetical protein VKR61_17835 [Bryobacteraceae bacterium]|nr:hypothetical protein [Bryobacteraceae bacterium]